MKWVRVESSNLAALGEDGADLLVKFKKGAKYRIPGAARLLPEMLAAESKGRAYNLLVRAAKLPAVRLCAVPHCLAPARKGDPTCGGSHSSG